MERYKGLFTQLKDHGEDTFIPLVTLGDPLVEQSLKVIDTLIEVGAGAFELGISLSDSLVDDLTIQEATLQTFTTDVTPSQCFEMLALIHQRHLTIPIGLPIYANLIFSKGTGEFYAQCERAGMDSVLVADVPVEESAPLRTTALRHSIAPIFICPPNADEELLRQITPYDRGYTYLFSRAGVTGVENRAALPLHYLVEKLKQYDVPLSLRGLGILAPEQVTGAIEVDTADAVPGSITVEIVEKNVATSDQMLAELRAFVSMMKTATQQ